jgi:hypothetical protein
MVINMAYKMLSLLLGNNSIGFTPGDSIMNEDTYYTRIETLIEDTELLDDLDLPPVPESWTIEDFSDILCATGA